MKKALIAVLAVIGAFAAGLFGVYMAMPSLAPGVVEEARAHLDSLARVDSLVRVLGLSAHPDSLLRSPGLIASATAPSDSLARQPGAGEATAGEGSAEAAAADPARDLVCLDTLVLVERRVGILLRERDLLREEVKALRTQLQARQFKDADVQALSATLTKMEDKELAGVVEQLDVDVLEALFLKASARNRTRLLQAMPPPTAASFVRRLIRPGEAPASEAAVGADSTAGKQPVGGLPEP